MNIKNKKKYILIFLFLSIFLISCKNISSVNTQKQNVNSQLNDYILKKTFYQVYDSYDMENISIKQLFSENDSLDRLINFNKALNDTFQKEYLEFKKNPIELIGLYSKNKDIVNGGRKNANQKVKINKKTQIVTPIEAIHLNNRTYDKLNISVIDGKNLESEDFLFNDCNVNILVGSDFIESYNIGDEINFIYAKKNWTGKIKGFINPGLKLNLNYGIFDLSNYFIIPFSNIKEDDIKDIKDNVYGDTNNDFLKYYYYFKNSGLFYFENHDKYNEYNEKFTSLGKMFDLDFELLRGY